MKTCKYCFINLLPTGEVITESGTQYKVMVCPDCDSVHYEPIVKRKWNFNKLKNNVAGVFLFGIMEIGLIFILDQIVRKL
jgi:hypothetical protein